MTFYYFADSYINFNSLVTDLFKIYKTRIWMSAINPASFASQPLGLQAPSGIGPGAVGVSRSTTNTERRQNQSQEPAPPTFATPNPAVRGFQASAGQQPFAERSVAMAGAYPPNFPYGPYGGAFGNIPRPPTAPYAGAMMPPATDVYGGFPQSAADYPSMRGRFPTPQGGPGQHEPGISPLTAQDWVGSFQGLSLNSR